MINMGQYSCLPDSSLECTLQLMKRQTLESLSDKRRILKLTTNDSITITRLQKEVSCNLNQV